ncbi:MAG: ABC transporter permease, partial [Promethearchaeota archaeon]
MSLVKFIVKRFLVLIPTLMAVIVISFLLGHFMPGNPFFGHVTRISQHEADKVAELTALYGVDLPIWDQFLMYLRNLITGNWGTAWSYYFFRMPVSTIIRFSLPRTLELMGLSLIVAFFLGKLLGGQVFSKKNKTRNNFVRFSLILISSIPVLLSGLVIQILLNKTPLREFTFGLSTHNQFPPFVTGMALLDCLIAGDLILFLDVALHYLLPVLVLSLPMLVIISQHVRSSVLDIMENDYIRTARAKGVPEKSVLHKHIYPNAMNTTLTIIGSSFSLFFVNAALVENVFRLNGIASLTIRA